QIGNESLDLPLDRLPVAGIELTLESRGDRSLVAAQADLTHDRRGRFTQREHLLRLGLEEHAAIFFLAELHGVGKSHGRASSCRGRVTNRSYTDGSRAACH